MGIIISDGLVRSACWTSYQKETEANLTYLWPSQLDLVNAQQC